MDVPLAGFLAPIEFSVPPPVQALSRSWEKRMSPSKCWKKSSSSVLLSIGSIVVMPVPLKAPVFDRKADEEPLIAVAVLSRLVVGLAGGEEVIDGAGLQLF